MKGPISRVFVLLLLILHAGLWVWAFVGLLEWFMPSVPWSPLSNELFPPWLLMLHWLSIFSAATIFLLGYTFRWPHTPNVMIAAYGFMAVVCAIETFWFMIHDLRYLAMALEYGAYLALIIALRRVPILVTRFKPVE